MIMPQFVDSKPAQRAADRIALGWPQFLNSQETALAPDFAR